MAHVNRKRQQVRTRHRRSAFTLLEVIVVVTIIALLATLVAPRVIRYIGSSKQKVAQAETSQIAKQVQLWCADNGHTKPPPNFELAMLLQGKDPYLNTEDDLVDPWGGQYVLVMPPTKNVDFDIISYGADSKPGGEGDDADITN
jgi:general secretion pathway protein G